MTRRKMLGMTIASLAVPAVAADFPLFLPGNRLAEYILGIHNGRPLQSHPGDSDRRHHRRLLATSAPRRNRRPDDSPAARIDRPSNTRARAYRCRVARYVQKSRQYCLVTSIALYSPDTLPVRDRFGKKHFQTKLSCPVR